MSSKPDAHDPLSPCEPCSSDAERNVGAAPGREEDAWHFKPAGLERPLHSGLRYEPGSFGDILKGAWAIEVARWLLASSQPLSCLDPFAGCETYAATDGTRGRAAKLGRGAWVRAQAPFLARGQVASTGRLLCETAIGMGAALELAVFDADPDRLATWKASSLSVRDDRVSPIDARQAIEHAEPSSDAASAMGRVKVEIIDASDGAHLIGDSEADLVFVDPYDFFDRADELVPRVLAQRRRSQVLVYLHNRAPRGGGHARAYARLREKLELDGGPFLIGRVPSDAVLPRSWHEVLLLGPSPPPPSVRSALERETKGITCKLATSGAFEDISRPTDNPEQGGSRSR